MVAGPGGTAFGVVIAYVLGRRGSDEDRSAEERREWEHSMEAQISRLDEKVDALREKAAEHTALLRYFLPWPSGRPPPN